MDRRPAGALVVESAPPRRCPPPRNGMDDPTTHATPSCGAYAAELIQRQTRRLGKLQPEVLADEDPEPLHQLRVSLRRLRTALGQFGPALVLPDGISDRRIARVARRTGLCRDLDVLRQRLDHELIPALPEAERKALRPVLKQLSRDRRQAFEGLVEALRSGPYLKLLARLHRWQNEPRYTPLGELPLRPWLFEWQAQTAAGLFLHPGWFAPDPQAAVLHDLRKRIKGVRYALEHLEPFGGSTLAAWILDLKRAQDDLGDLHDLQVLGDALDDQLEGDLDTALPCLRLEIGRRSDELWREWQEHGASLRSDPSRRALYASLLAAPA